MMNRAHGLADRVPLAGAEILDRSYVSRGPLLCTPGIFRERLEINIIRIPDLPRLKGALDLG
jgi:hypothetical protein